MPREIIVASGNMHKVQEISEILAPLGYDVKSAVEFGGMPDVVEDADTFEGNAAKKAVEGAKALGRILYNIVLVLPSIDMNPPWVYMCSPS